MHRRPGRAASSIPSWPEERRRALAEMGVDGEGLRARADALFERVQGAAGEQVKEQGVSSREAARETGAGIGHGHGDGIGDGHTHGIGHGNGERQKGEGNRYGVGRGMRRGARIAWVGVALAAGVAVLSSCRRGETRISRRGTGPMSSGMARLRRRLCCGSRRISNCAMAIIELASSGSTKRECLIPRGTGIPRCKRRGRGLGVGYCAGRKKKGERGRSFE